MSSIFISHSSRDSEVAAEIRERLARAGHRSVFLDFDPADGIPAGRSWEQELYAQLRACRAVIVVCSASSMASDWVFAEITHARALGKPVFSLRVDSCEIRSLLTDNQVVDLTTEREEGFERLWRGLRLAGLDPESAFDWDGSRPPYPGLLAFQEADAAIFFGRGKEIGEGLSLLHRLRRFGGTNWMLTLGSSGSGKSSLVRAGLLPRLRRDRDGWLVVGPIRPHDRPVAQLTDALTTAFIEAGDERPAAAVSEALSQPTSRARGQALRNQCTALCAAAGSPEARVLLVIDQFEELLVAGAGTAARDFLATLRQVTDGPDPPLFVLATLRSDFLGEFQSHPALREMAFASLSVGPLSVAGFTEIIEGPATLAGIELESGLVQTLVADTETDDALPLLAFTLRELWEGAADRQRLTAGDYRERLGGLHGSVARAADTALGSGSEPGSEEPLLRSAFLAMARIDDEGNFVRQSAAWSALPPATHAVLERFVAARLLISRGDGEERYLEVAHEALLRVWERLVGWLAAARALLVWRKRLGESENEWQRNGRRKGYLLRGPALGEAAGWLAKRPDLLNKTETAFIRASVRNERWRRYRLVALFAAVAVALALFAFNAEQLRQRAERTKSGATDLTKLTAARRMRRMAPSVGFAANQLLESAGRSLVRMERPELFSETMDLDIVALSIAGVSNDLMVAALRVDTGIEARFTLDRRWRVTLDHPAPVLLVEIEGPVASRSRGRRILTAAGDGTVRLWVLPDLSRFIEWILEESRPEQLDAFLGPGAPNPAPQEAELLLAFDGHAAPVSQLLFSPEGQYAASVAGDQVALWRGTSGAAPVVLGGAGGELTSAVFSRDGKRLMTTSSDQRAYVYDVTDLLASPLRLEGHTATVRCGTFGPRGELMLTAASDREVWQWSSRGAGSRVATIDCEPTELKYTETPGKAAIGCADGTVRILDLASGVSEEFS